MPKITDKREGMANQLLMRGHASMMEILTASFGEWPPRGLKINPNVLHEQRVELKPLLEEICGRGNYVGKPEIELNKAECEKYNGLHSTMGHEAVHILQGNNSYGGRGSMIKGMVYMLFGMDKPASNIIMKKLTSRKEGGLCEAFTRVANASGLDKWREEISYIRQGTEVQARIHQIMIEGYPRWGKMPANSDEFYAAMQNAGLKLPPEIEQRLESLPVNSSAYGFLACAKGRCVKVPDIQVISDSLADSGKNIFWNKTLPALYADLIEMYGDVQGAKRFGLGANLKSEVAQKNAPVAKQTTPSPS